MSVVAVTSKLMAEVTDCKHFTDICMCLCFLYSRLGSRSFRSVFS
jgi:hypothetical protein